MRIAHTEPSKYHTSARCHHGAGTIYFMALWDKSAFQTPWLFIHRGVLSPKSGIGHHAHDTIEEMYTIFDGSARFTYNGATAELNAELKGPVMVPCFKGDSHGIYNHTDKEVQFMNIGVASPGGSYDNRDFGDDLVNVKLVSPDKLPARYIDKSALKYVNSAHKGKGTLGFRRVWGADDFKTTWGFIDHVLIPPDGSIGYHRHDTIEECYLILSGKGLMTVDNETQGVKVGDAIPNRLGGSHGIYNHTDQELELINICVCLEKGKFDATDHGDDLSRRKA